VAAVGGGVMAVAQWIALRDRADRTLLALMSGAVFALAIILGVAGGVVAVVGGAALLWTSRAAQRRLPAHAAG